MLSSRPLRFPEQRLTCDVLQVDILSQVASQQLVLHPTNDTYSMGIPYCDGGESASFQISLTQPTAASSSRAPSEAGSTVHSYADSALKAHSDAKEYLDGKGVLKYMQSLLETMVRSQPEEPFEFMLVQLRSLVDRGELTTRGSEAGMTREAGERPASKEMLAQAQAELLQAEAARQSQRLEAAAAKVSELTASNKQVELRAQALEDEAGRLAIEAAGLRAREDAAAKAKAACSSVAGAQSSSAVQVVERQLRADVAEAEQGLQAAERKLATLASRASELKRSEQEACAKLMEMRAESLVSERKVKAAEEEFRRLSDEVGRLQSQHLEQRSRNAEAEAQVRRHEAELSQLAQEGAKLTARDSAVTAEVGQLKANNMQAETRLKALQEEAAGLSAVAKQLTSQEQAITSMGSDVKVGNKSVEDRVRLAEQDLIGLSVEAGLLKSREAAATEKAAELRASNAEAERRAKAREEEAKRLAQEAAEIRGREEAATNSLRAEADRQAKGREQVQAARVAEEKARLQTVEQEVQKLSLEADALRAREQDARSRKGQLEAANCQAKERAKSLEDEVQAKEGEAAAGAARAKAAEARLQETGRQADAVSAEVADLTNKELDVQQKLKALHEERAAASDRTAQAEREAVQQCNATAELERRHDAARTAISEMQAAHERAASQSKAAEEEADRLGAELARLNRAAEAAFEQGGSLKARVEEAERSAQAAAKEQEDLAAREAGLRKQAEASRAESAEAARRAEASQKELDEAKAKLNEVHKRIQEAEEEIALLSLMEAKQRAREEDLRSAFRKVSLSSAQAAEMRSSHEDKVALMRSRNQEAEGQLQRLETDRLELERMTKEAEVARLEQEKKAKAAEDGLQKQTALVEGLKKREEAALKKLEEMKAPSSELESKAKAAEDTLQKQTAVVAELKKREEAALKQLEELKTPSWELMLKAKVAEDSLQKHQALCEEMSKRGEAALKQLEELKENESTKLDVSPVKAAKEPDSDQPEMNFGASASTAAANTSQLSVTADLDQSMSCHSPQASPIPQMSRVRKKVMISRVSAEYQPPARQFDHRIFHYSGKEPLVVHDESPRQAVPSSNVPLLTQSGYGLSRAMSSPCIGPYPAANLSVQQVGLPLARVHAPAVLAPVNVRPPMAQDAGPALSAPALPIVDPGGKPSRRARHRATVAEAEEAPQQKATPASSSTSTAQHPAASEAAKPAAAETPPPPTETQAAPAAAPAKPPTVAEVLAEAKSAVASVPAAAAAGVLPPPLAEDAPADSSKQVRRVRIWTLDRMRVKKILFELSDGTVRRFGDDGGEEQEPFEVPAEQYLAKVHVRCRESGGEPGAVSFFHEGVSFETNQEKRSIWYGGKLGTPSTYVASGGHHINGFKTASGLPSGAPVGIVEHALLDMKALASAGSLCSETLDCIQKLAHSRDSWCEIKMLGELERATWKVSEEQARTLGGDCPSQALQEELASRCRARAEGMFDAVAARDEEGFLQLSGDDERELSAENFRSLVNDWQEGNGRDVCDNIVEAARDQVFCLACGGEGCGLCRPR